MLNEKLSELEIEKKIDTNKLESDIIREDYCSGIINYQQMIIRKNEQVGDFLKLYKQKITYIRSRLII